MKPLLESAGILKIGFNIKFNAVMLAQHGITCGNLDDAQLMSYALDAGRNAARARGAGRALLGHPSSTMPAHRQRQDKLSFDQVAIDKAAEYSAKAPT